MRRLFYRRREEFHPVWWWRLRNHRARWRNPTRLHCQTFLITPASQTDHQAWFIMTSYYYTDHYYNTFQLHLTILYYMYTIARLAPSLPPALDKYCLLIALFHIITASVWFCIHQIIWLYNKDFIISIAAVQHHTLKPKKLHLSFCLFFPYRGCSAVRFHPILGRYLCIHWKFLFWPV